MKNFDAFFQKIYAQPIEARQHWYAEATQAYDQYRAPYMPEIIDLICGKIKPESVILEIGSGPGNATQHFAQRGFSLICLEPNPRACKFAAQRFQNYPIQIINTTFEEWGPTLEKFDTILASTSFHWLQPDTRCQAIASLLKPQGNIVLLWNTVPQPDPTIFQDLLPLYEKYMPSFASFENIAVQEQNLKNISQGLLDSNCFQNLELTQIIETKDYSPNDYLKLLTTLSPYIALDSTVRRQLFDELKAVFQARKIQTIPTQYICAAHIAQVKPPN
ncbi:class I SAM-dependent methyltransferase [Picosynechococcus sp. PCC 73109]|uniref:class I SAM-dependent methyltransferase n=1 Tax=Picosynechococcus sp. PCC 73109 TaxID=374982 RepID=UPI00074587AB|nr:class I SAM-dependent methyltransferase [Picosynechococcus sp. PCC 73109]AMA09005.1 methyltransferase type 12 [Picosynechococcus sp. PCC 73109]